jgi:hypothetical protein
MEIDMRNRASKTGLRLAGIGVPLGMSLAAPVFAASFVTPPDWSNYVLVASLAALALGLIVKALEGPDGSRRENLSDSPTDSIDIYRNSALKP